MGGIERAQNRKINPYLAAAGGVGLGLGALSLYNTYKQAQAINQLKNLASIPLQMIPL